MKTALSFPVNPMGFHLCYTFCDEKSHVVYYNYTVLVAAEFLPDPNWEVSEHAWVEFGQWPDPLHFGMQVWLQDLHGEGRLRTLVRQITDGNLEA